jgi:hypothetical protein
MGVGRSQRIEGLMQSKGFRSSVTITDRKWKEGYGFWDIHYFQWSPLATEIVQKVLIVLACSTAISDNWVHPSLQNKTENLYKEIQLFVVS